MDAYLESLKRILDDLDRNSICDFLEVLEVAHANDNTVFIIGNGGSAATASHMTNDLSLSEFKAGRKKALRVQSLTDNIPLITAIANDESYEDIFLRQLQIYRRPGDVLLAVSASGNSPNIIKAVEWFRSDGGRVASFVGFDGGKLRQLSDVFVHVRTEKGEYGLVEDVHMILDHMCMLWIYRNSL